LFSVTATVKCSKCNYVLSIISNSRQSHFAKKIFLMWWQKL